MFDWVARPAQSRIGSFAATMAMRQTTHILPLLSYCLQRLTRSIPRNIVEVERCAATELDYAANRCEELPGPWSPSGVGYNTALSTCRGHINGTPLCNSSRATVLMLKPNVCSAADDCAINT